MPEQLAGDDMVRADTMDKNCEVVEREMGRARVTMEWEVDAEFETTEGGNVRCVGWLANAVDVVAQCNRDHPKVLTISRVDG